MLAIYAQSTQYLEVPITNVTSINPTSDVVQFAFLGPVSNVSQANEQVPTSSTTYYAGTWQSTSPAQGTTNTYNALVLVGPNGGVVTLNTGTYLVIVKVLDTPEHPVLFSGPVAVS